MSYKEELDRLFDRCKTEEEIDKQYQEIVKACNKVDRMNKIQSGIFIVFIILLAIAIFSG